MHIVLVDDHVMFREGVAGLLRSQPWIKVVSIASTVSQAIDFVQTQKPDLILMDYILPDGTGLDAAQEILFQHPDIKIVFLSVHEDDDHLFAALRCGAIGYLLHSLAEKYHEKRLGISSSGFLSLKDLNIADYDQTCRDYEPISYNSIITALNTIDIKSERDVFIDDKNAGKTKKKLRVKKGTHLFHLGDPKDYTPGEIILKIKDTTEFKPEEITFAAVPDDA